MSRKILITGVTGLIGKSVCNELCNRYPTDEVTALIKPKTNIKRITNINSSVKLVYIDLADLSSLKSYLANNFFDIVFHIGALRGGRKANKNIYYRVNVEATEQLLYNALINHTRFIFCSSVGVFGTIPTEIPANNETSYQADNYYHYTKIECEKKINQYILKGLQAVILRPSITYGIGDYGFPWQLIRLVDKKLLPLTNKNLWIHLCHIETITSAFVDLVENKELTLGKSFNIADLEPVQFRDLVNFISRQLNNTNYPKYLTIDNKFLYWGVLLAKLLHNELWTSRFQLISQSWFYNVQDSYKTLNIVGHYTIPDFKFMTDYYLSS